MAFVLAGWVVFRAVDFSTAASILASLVGAHGFGGVLGSPGLMIAAALVSALIPSAHEIKDIYLRPWPALAAAAGATAVYCMLEVGQGPPLNFIYFQF